MNTSWRWLLVEYRAEAASPRCTPLALICKSWHAFEICGLGAANMIVNLQVIDPQPYILVHLFGVSPSK